MRQWHKWGGVAAGTLLLVLGTSGIFLNYKQPIFARLGVETKRGERDASPLPASKSSVQVEFTTSAGVSGGAVDFSGALAVARAEWGDVPLERAEVRAERGSVIYRFRKNGGAELWVNAADGKYLAKGEYERIGKAGSDGVPARKTDWGKILIDLHTGRIGGEAGKAVMSCAGLLLLLLTLSGFYMWAKPILVRLQHGRIKTSSGRVSDAGSVSAMPARNLQRGLAEP
jgi:hypothetical protein